MVAMIQLITSIAGTVDISPLLTQSIKLKYNVLIPSRAIKITTKQKVSPFNVNIMKTTI